MQFSEHSLALFVNCPQSHNLQLSQRCNFRKFYKVHKIRNVWQNLQLLQNSWISQTCTCLGEQIRNVHTIYEFCTCLETFTKFAKYRTLGTSKLLANDRTSNSRLTFTQMPKCLHKHIFHKFGQHFTKYAVLLKSTTFANILNFTSSQRFTQLSQISRTKIISFVIFSFCNDVWYRLHTFAIFAKITGFVFF